MSAKINKNVKFFVEHQFARSRIMMAIDTVLADIFFGEVLPQSSVSKKG